MRDNIHSYDLVNALWHFFQNPRSGEVYNMGGSRFANCSVLEAIGLCEEITGRPMSWNRRQGAYRRPHLVDQRRAPLPNHYPAWRYKYDLRSTLEDICEGFRNRGAAPDVDTGRGIVLGRGGCSRDAVGRHSGSKRAGKSAPDGLGARRGAGR